MQVPHSCLFIKPFVLAVITQVLQTTLFIPFREIKGITQHKEDKMLSPKKKKKKRKERKEERREEEDRKAVHFFWSGMDEVA